MRHSIIILLCTLYTTVAAGQKIDWDDTSFNHGTVHDWDSPAAVFKLKNTGKSKLMFLPQHYGRDVQVILPNHSIMPGQTAEVVIHYYTANTGSFSKSIEVFSNASDKAQTLTVRGNIASLRNNALTACPTFGQEMPTSSSNANTLTVIDRSTGAQIADARVEVFKKRQSEAVYQSDQRGLVRSKLGSGTYTAQVQKEGYFPTVQEFEFGRSRRTVIVFLDPIRKQETATTASSHPKTETTDIVEIPAEELGINVDDQWQEQETPSSTAIDLGIATDEQWEESVPKTQTDDLGIGINGQWTEETELLTPDAVPSQPVSHVEIEEDLGLAVNDQWQETEPLETVREPSITPEDAEAAVEAALAALELEPEFSEKTFRPNNIVLLLDVSSSMRKEGKLDALKQSAARMIGMMRSVDRLTILAFNASVWTVLEPTPVTTHDSIIALVNGLEAEGYTSGVKGMKEAYERLLTEWVEDGNNQLILVTDGMFTSSSFTEKDATDMAAEHAKRGTILSVVGFENKEDGGKMMKRIARKGNGSYLQLDGTDDPVGVLAEEIKLRSRRL